MTLIDADEFMSELKKYKYARKILAESIINKINHYTDDDIITHAHWTTRYSHFPFAELYLCSNCKMETVLPRKFDYCPDCGARMDEVINNE